MVFWIIPDSAFGFAGVSAVRSYAERPNRILSTE
jgi:hypothetical protein